MRVVAALGGNALVRRGEPLDVPTQRANLRLAAEQMAAIARDHELVVTHGNGPQVGLLALQAAARPEDAPTPLDVLGAESEGMIGYLVEQELRNVAPEREIATLLTQVVVDPRDPAFDRPSKPIGPVYPRARGEALAAERGWSLAPDAGGVRRVVPSPEPLRILEIGTIRLLLAAGVIVVCAGGGGIPVAAVEGGLRGIEAVIDKDRAAALLAVQLGAQRLLLLTDVDAVYTGWGTPRARALGRVRPDALDPADFEPGTMAPKVEAACRFVRETGGRAAIASLEQARAALAGEAGTRVAGADA